MLKKFNKKELVSQCGLTKEEADLILLYQTKLPILVENENDEGFCVNARDLWVQLGEPQGKFASWVERKFSAYGFVENSDYISFSQNCEKPQGGRPSDEYMLTLDMAKQLAMVDKKECGFIARRYFLLMEKAMKLHASWKLVRDPMKRKYKEMDKALDDYLLATVGRVGDKYDYAAEADALNIIATGFKAQSIRVKVGCKDNITRDSLTEIYNRYLMTLQEQNIIYLKLGFNKYQRYTMLLDVFNALYPKPLMLMDASPATVNKNKEEFLSEIKEKMGI